MPPDNFTKYEITDGGIVDPPRIAFYEQQLTDASASGDQSQIDAVMEDYHNARRDIAERHNRRVDERLDEDRRLLADADTRRQEESRARADAAATQARREEADRLRAERSPLTPPTADTMDATPDTPDTPDTAPDAAPDTTPDTTLDAGSQGGDNR